MYRDLDLATRAHNEAAVLIDKNGEIKYKTILMSMTEGMILNNLSRWT